MDAMISKLCQSINSRFADSGNGFDLGRWLLFCKCQTSYVADAVYTLPLDHSRVIPTNPEKLMLILSRCLGRGRVCDFQPTFRVPRQR